MHIVTMQTPTSLQPTNPTQPTKKTNFRPIPDPTQPNPTRGSTQPTDNSACDTYRGSIHTRRFTDVFVQLHALLKYFKIFSITYDNRIINDTVLSQLYNYIRLKRTATCSN